MRDVGFNACFSVCICSHSKRFFRRLWPKKGRSASQHVSLCRVGQKHVAWIGQHKLRQTRTILNASVGSAGGLGYSAFLYTHIYIYWNGGSPLLWLIYCIHYVSQTSTMQCAILRHATVYKVGEPSSMFIKWASHPVGIVAGAPIWHACWARLLDTFP